MMMSVETLRASEIDMTLAVSILLLLISNGTFLPFDLQVHYL